MYFFENLDLFQVSHLQRQQQEKMEIPRIKWLKRLTAFLRSQLFSSEDSLLGPLQPWIQKMIL